MKYLLYSLLLLFGTTLYGQSTFNKVFDLDSNAIRNYLHDFSIFEDKIYTYSSTFCDLQNSEDASCVAFTKFDNKGNLIEKKLIDTFNSFEYCHEGLTETENNLIFSTYIKEEKFKKNSLYDLGDQLNPQLLKKYEITNSNSDLLNTGLKYIDNYIYIFGSVHNLTYLPDSAQIIKIDDAGNEIWRKYYTNDNASLKVNSLQGTPDGNLAFILELSGPAGNNDYFEGYHIMKIDTNGTVIDSFVIEEDNKQHNRLLVASDGSYYVGLNSHLDKNDILFFTGASGAINKLNANLDSIVWSYDMPNNQVLDGRYFEFFDFLEARNGDIIACGTVYDKTDTEHASGAPDKNSVWNGFIIRLTSDGEVKWLRLYKNKNDLLPQEEYGRYRPSRLDKIKELPDGRLVCAGNVYVNNRQYSGIDETETEGLHLWLLMVDENGCMEGEECEEIIKIDGKIVNEDPLFPIGTTWTYEYVYKEPLRVVHSTVDFTVTDTVVYKGKMASLVKNTLGDTIYLSEEGNNVYVYDDRIRDYTLTFDFDAVHKYSDSIQYYRPFHGDIQSTKVYIDSITKIHTEDRGWLSLQFLKYTYFSDCFLCEEGDTIHNYNNDEVLYQIGRTRGGRVPSPFHWRQAPLTGEWVFPYYGKLRCFSSGDDEIDFLPIYPPESCDTTYYVYDLPWSFNQIDTKNTWYVLQQNQDKLSTFSYSLTNDSFLIEDHFYKMIVKSESEEIKPNSPTNLYLRQDGSRVYRLHNGKEQLIYDYNHQPGDVFDFIDMNGDVTQLRCIKVDTIDNYGLSLNLKLSYACVVNGEPSEEVCMQVISGIGTLQGIEFGNPLGRSDLQLNCMYKNNQKVYFYSFIDEISDCWIETVNTEEGSYDETIILYPNPAYDVLNIESELSMKNISIYSIEGNLLFYRGAINKNSYTLDISPSWHGLVILKIEDSSGRVTILKETII